MGKKLYVGNLPYSIDDQKLMQAFAGFGQVTSAKVIIDRDSGRSKGFGFVEMSSEDEAHSAINSMNGNELEGRAINVSEARENEGGRGAGGRGGFNNRSGGGSRGGGHKNNGGSRFGGNNGGNR